VVAGGRVQGYFLSTYSARKLGMRTTGNAGGSHNLTLTSRLTQPGDDLDAMLRKLGTGLFVIELMGQGVNYVTGDYSRGASGFWVENGRIAYPVQEITIAGNLRRHVQGHPGRGRRCLQPRRQDGGLGPDQPDEVGRFIGPPAARNRSPPR
jgi:PmbA protein